MLLLPKKLNKHIKQTFSETKALEVTSRMILAIFTDYSKKKSKSCSQDTSRNEPLDIDIPDK